MLYLYANTVTVLKHQKLKCAKYTKKKKNIDFTRRRWNRTTEYVSSPTDLKSALHTSEDHPRITGRLDCSLD